MSKGTFGDHLKREREMRGVSLDEISAATRIATRFLQAIENEQWDKLPGGVFNRGFVLATGGWYGVRRIFAWRASRRAGQINAASAPSPRAQPPLPSAGEPFPVSAEPAPAPPPNSSALPRGADSTLVPATGPISPAPTLPFKLKVEAGKTTSVTVE